MIRFKRCIVQQCARVELDLDRHPGPRPLGVLRRGYRRHRGGRAVVHEPGSGRGRWDARAGNQRRGPDRGRDGSCAANRDPIPLLRQDGAPADGRPRPLRDAAHPRQGWRDRHRLGGCGNRDGDRPEDEAQLRRGRPERQAARDPARDRRRRGEVDRDHLRQRCHQRDARRVRRPPRRPRQQARDREPVPERDAARLDLRRRRGGLVPEGQPRQGSRT